MRYGERYVMVKFDTMNWKVPVGLGVLACVFAAFGNPEIFNRDTFRGVVALTGIVAMIWGIDLRRRNEHLQREAERRAEMRRGGVMFNTSRTVIRPAKDPEVTQRAAAGGAAWGHGGLIWLACNGAMDASRRIC